MLRGDPKGNHWEQEHEREGEVKIETTTNTTDESNREREVVRVNSANDRNMLTGCLGIGGVGLVPSLCVSSFYF